MSVHPTNENNEFIWATRGRTWGFRFLRNGGFDDPLSVYDSAFSNLDDQTEVWGRIDDMVALRFSDPDGRRDAAGRVIPHEFVLLGPWADGVTSFEDGVRLVWERVADEFEDVWDETEPSSGL